MGRSVEQRQRQRLAALEHLLDLLAPRSAGAGQHETQARPFDEQTLGGVEEQSAKLADLSAATARHQRHDLSVRRQSEPSTGRSAIRLQGNGVGQGVADETHGHPMLFVETRFEGEQRQHQVAGFANLQHPLLPPGPHRRADVMHGTQASLAQLVFDTEGEVGGVDADHHVRARVDERADQTLAPSQQLRQPAQHLDQAHHR